MCPVTFIMNYENWISYRYLTASKGRFLSFLHFVSVAGIAVGVMALIIVIGIMTGFGNNLRDKIIGTTPHVAVEKETGILVNGIIENPLGVYGLTAFRSGNDQMVVGKDLFNLVFFVVKNPLEHKDVVFS